MTLPRRIILGAAGIAVVAIVAWAANRLYVAPAARLRTDLEKDRGVIRNFEEALKDRSRPGADLKAVAATTLGATEEAVDASLRERLNAIAAGAGLAEVRVDSHAPDPEASPAGRARVKGEMGRELRRRPDFWAARGTLTGQGTLEQALRTLATLRAQPWVHRVESFSLRPEGKDRTRFTLSVGVASLIMPDLLGPSFTPPPVATLSESEALALAPIVAKNVFKQPPPDQAVAQRPPGPPPGPPSPYLDWKLTGIVEAGSQVEAWMHNTRSNERLTLGVGATVADAKLLAAGGERAVFEIAGKRFEVFNGQTLEQRRPTD